MAAPLGELLSLPCHSEASRVGEESALCRRTSRFLARQGHASEWQLLIEYSKQSHSSAGEVCWEFAPLLF